MALTDRLARRVIDSDVDLTGPSLLEEVERVVDTEAPLAPPTTPQDVVDRLFGLGPLEALLREPGISDVLVNGPNQVWIERDGELERSSVIFSSDDAVVAAVERTIGPLGLRLDRASPIVSARLPDGSRLHAAIPPVAVDGPIVAIRRFTSAVVDLPGFVAASAMTEEQATYLTAAVQERRSIVVSGATGAGKTTLLNALARVIPPSERVVTIEDAAELRFPGHVVRLEARPANSEGVGEVDMADLVRAALRLRPDRIVVGEVRGAEALDMLAAMNTGHAGSLSTVHANGPEDALWRLETLALTAAGPGEQAVRRQLWSAIDVVVHIGRHGSTRRVESIAEVDLTGIREVDI